MGDIESDQKGKNRGFMEFIRADYRWIVIGLPISIFVILLFLLGAVITADSVTTLFGLGSPFRDSAPPDISSKAPSIPHCRFTKILPDAKVEDTGGFWSKTSGIRIIKLYVGGEKIGEWPLEEPYFTFDLKGENAARYATAPSGYVRVVAEDGKGNTSVEIVLP